jgi:hypothetical protein
MDESQTPVDRVWSSPSLLGFWCFRSFILFLRFDSSLSLSLRHRTSQEKESKGEGPESQASHQQQDGYQRHACTRSAHRFSCLCKSHLILKPKILHIVALLAIHDLAIHTFWSHLQMHGSHFDSAYELYELICCCMKNVFLIHIGVLHHLRWKSVPWVVLSLPRFQSTLVHNYHYNVLV